MPLSPNIYILKTVIDLIKVDNRIHHNEIDWIKKLSEQFDFSAEDLQLAHRLTFKEAIENLQELDKQSRNEIITLIEQIASVDNDIDTRERIILSVIRLALQEESRAKVQILSVEAENFDRYDKQLIYLEQKENPAITDAIAHNHDIIYSRLKNIDIEFFFLSDFIQRLSHSQSYFENAIKILFPYFHHEETSESVEPPTECKTSEYCSFIRRLMGASAEAFRFDSFFLIKIQDNIFNGRRMADFLCLECSANPEESIKMFIDSLLLKSATDSIPYEGCFRSFFEMMSEKSKCNYNLLLKGNLFYLSGVQEIPLEIRGIERKTLFTLFLLHGNEGISNDSFATISSHTALGQEAICIYRYFATEKAFGKIEKAISDRNEPDIIINLRDTGKRLSHIGFIKKAFIGITQLKDPHLYFPQNIKGEFTYNITLPQNMILGQHLSQTYSERLSISFFK